MKRIVSILIAACILTLSSVSISKAQVNINVNIGAQPLWGPTGYDAVEYYYLPDLQMYYYVPSHQFIYMSNGRWLFVNSLPARYHSYNLYSGYKVVINEPKPYLHFATHKVEYGKYRGWKAKQVVIRDSRDPKYFVVKGHPGNAKGHYKQPGEGNSGGNNGNIGHGQEHGQGQGQGQGHGQEHGQGQGQGHGGGKGKKG
jgi:hypothetical protein